MIRSTGLCIVLLFLLGIVKAQLALDYAGLSSGTPAASAYSLRLLSSSYSGFAIQVRRSSDDATQNIGFNSSNELDTASLKSFVGSGNGYVTIWYDQSGNARDMNQSSAASQPSIMNAGVLYYRNGKPTLYHDNADDGFQFGTDYLTTLPVSVNVIAGSNSSGTSYRRAVQGTVNWLIGPYSNTHSWYASGWNHQVAAPWSLSNVELFTVIQPATNPNSSYRNGTAVITSNNKGVPGRMQTGAKGAYAEPLDGFVSEVLVFNADLSTARTLLELNQSSYYGIQLPNPLDVNGQLNSSASAQVNRNGAIGASSGIYRTGSSFSTLSVGALTTTAASSISSTGAVTGGVLSSDGGANIVAGVCYSTSPNPTISNSITFNSGASGSYSSTLSMLQGNTTYYVRAYATNALGTLYGNEISFTTLPPVVPVISATTAASSINSTSAVSGGTISSDGGAPVTARGVVVSSVHVPTLADTVTSNGTGNGTFSSSITGLTLGVTYYVRAYATNTAGTSYGETISFTTALGVGDSYQGGIIYYLFRNGDPCYVAGEVHGLIAATSNLSTSARWYNVASTSTGATATALCTGLSNSNAIIATYGNIGTFAAKLCRDYTGGSYTDWYLPSKDELYKMFQNKSVLSGLSSIHWTSTEFSSSTAYRMSMTTGTSVNSLKTTLSAVRAIRRF